MADTENNGGASGEVTKKPSQSVEVMVGGDRVSSAIITRDPSKPASEADVKTSSAASDSGLMLEIGEDGNRRTGLGAPKPATKEEGEGDASEEQGGKEDGEGDETQGDDEGSDAEGDGEEGSEGSDPGEYDPEDPEVVAKFDKRYWNEEGTSLNLAAFTPELDANLKAGKADISKGGREYLKDKLGLSDEAINQHIEGVVAVRAKQETAFYGMTGGKEAYEAMIGWGSTAYTAGQKARFNEALATGDPEVIQEQIDLLKVRFEKAGQTVPAAAQEGTKGGVKAAPGAKGPPAKRKPLSPAKSASESAAPSSRGVEPYADNTEYRAALKAAGSDEKKQAEVRKRLVASKHLWQA